MFCTAFNWTTGSGEEGLVRAEASAEFEWWFRASYSSVERTVFLVLGDRGRAEEIAQDAFIKMLQRWSEVRSYDRPDAWVRRVAVRMAVRSAKRERARPDLERLASAPDPEAPVLPDPDLAAAVHRLSPMQRVVVVLFYWEDNSVFEIARALGVSESTVKQHLFRARARIATLLGEEVSDDVR
jgi:RNA polymerase sigma-70 factor (ECF subfamily)